MKQRTKIIIALVVALLALASVVLRYTTGETLWYWLVFPVLVGIALVKNADVLAAWAWVRKRTWRRTATPTQNRQ